MVVGSVTMRSNGAAVEGDPGIGQRNTGTTTYATQGDRARSSRSSGLVLNIASRATSEMFCSFSVNSLRVSTRS